MKKTQVALAALALVASSAAMAEGVTVYGTMDASVGKVTDNRTHVDGTGNWSGSVFGFKGSEDLDGGLKAFFNLEMGLNLSNGTQNNGGTTPTQGVIDTTADTPVFNRLANVGLSSELGTLTIGQQLNQFVAGTLGSNLNANESFYVPFLLVGAGGTGALFGGGGGSGTNGGFFQPNLITYSAPSLGGVNISLQTQVRGNSNNGQATTASDTMNAASASYSFGDATVTGAYMSRKETTKAYSIGGTYNMGDLTFNGRYINYNDTSTANSTDINTWNVGVSYALNGSTSVSAQYASNNQTDSQTITNVGLQHNLSKSTYLYGTISRATNNALALYSQLYGAGTSNSTSTTGYAIGIVKNF